jgi:hypothetical protein
MNKMTKKASAPAKCSPKISRKSSFGIKNVQ